MQFHQSRREAPRGVGRFGEGGHLDRKTSTPKSLEGIEGQHVQVGYPPYQISHGRLLDRQGSGGLVGITDRRQFLALFSPSASLVDHESHP
jgi:hypothetical protein